MKFIKLKYSNLLKKVYRWLLFGVLFSKLIAIGYMVRLINLFTKQIKIKYHRGNMESTDTSNNKFLLPEGKFKFWRYLVLIVFLVVITLITQAILLLIASLIEGTVDINVYSSLTLLWVTMLPFAVLLICLIAGVRLLHQQSLKSIFTQKSRFNWNLLTKSAIVWFILSGISDLIISLFQPGNYVFSFSLDTFVIYMLAAVLLISFQVTAEEVLFRSYLLHGFTRLFKNKWVAIISQALLFGVLHGANPEVSTYGLLTTMPFYIGIGLLLGWLSMKFWGLEIAIGLHFANNLYATAMVTFTDSAISSPAVFTISNYQPEVGLIAFLITSVVFSVIISKNKDEISIVNNQKVEDSVHV